MRVLRSLSSLVAVTVIAATGVVLAQPASAVSQIDQSDTVNTSTSVALYSIQTVGQSFTAGITGSLTRVTMNVRVNSGTADVTAKLFAADGSGYPTGSVLASVTVPASNLGTTTPYAVDFSFASPARVVAGSKYAIALETPESSGFFPVYVSTAGYASGKGFWCNPSACTWQDIAGQYDFGFTTYVDPDGPRDLTVWQKSYARASATEICQSGWDPSWMQWPNAGTGGFVCVRNTYAYYPDVAYAG